ncbi:MAG: TetR/AcrR family transcriptional regulator [Ectothiorhodospiraceae bacterium]|nr:TetR/AcrR family transcriptional regulator [Ectothiorhodospiraceae bacterium]
MATTGKRARRKSREQRSEEIRAALFRAAEEVVGEYGYRDASIARITQRAGVAQGTFYLYFKSRQELFDQLLPHLGQELMEYLKQRVRESKNVIDLEEQGFRGFFEFLQFNPSFFRILNEAEVEAPKAHAVHFERLRSRYMAALKRSWNRGEIPGFDERELEVLVYIFMAARSYLYLRYSKTDQGPRPLPDWVVHTYMKFVKGGLGYNPSTNERHSDSADAPGKR